ncbi:MAG: DUF58 domain-containing protein [Thermodesulfobacteriota bacterium]|nr:DUF58 domain-containing protein [Thermodesulfobacteriota bacterium]
MIVPKPRLIFWTLMVFLPLSTLAVVGFWTVALYAGLVALLFMLAVADAVMAFRNLDGISVELPETVRLSKGREGGIRLRVNNERMKVRRIRLGLPFPGEIRSQGPDLTAELPGESRSSFLTWPCTPLKQGRFTIDICYFEVVSPLDFWAVRARQPVQAEIRVYPNLLAERKSLAALFLHHGFGIHRHRQIGKGRDFEKLREYVPGDNFEDIHWKATARRRHPITKVFQIERTQQVYIILDGSRLSGRSSDSPGESRGKTDSASGALSTIMDRFVTASLIMGLAAEQQGDQFGLLTFSDRVRGFVRAKGGRHYFNACREMLYTLEPQAVTPDFAELFSYIGLKIRRRAMLIFLTNLDDPVLAESFVKNIDLISKRHLVLVSMLKPAGARPLFSSLSVESVNDIYKDLGGHILRETLREIEKVLKRRGVGFALLDNENMSTELVSRYLNIKQRQLL